MFPKTFEDKIVCLESLLGIRSGCTVPEQFEFWLEDIDGIDIKKLASMARGSNLSGKDFGNQLINSAAREMMADISLLLNNGYRMPDVVGDVCSKCNLIPSYTNGGGIVVKSVIATRFSIMRMQNLTILANATGTQNIVIDDGVTPVVKSVNLQAGVLMPIKLNYSTPEKRFAISFQDANVPAGQIVCSTNSSCGCGGAITSNNPVNISGILNGTEGSTQYGFLPCVAVDCSYDAMVCGLIQQVPNIFGQALMYKAAVKFYGHRGASDRNNDAVSYGEQTEEEQTPLRKYETFYWARMQGKNDRRAIKNVINDYLKTIRTDKCVICDSKLKTAYVTG